MTDLARRYSQGDFSDQAVIRHDTRELRELGQVLHSLRVNAEQHDAQVSDSRENHQ
jgi:hypothetical protein